MRERFGTKRVGREEMRRRRIAKWRAHEFRWPAEPMPLPAMLWAIFFGDLCQRVRQAMFLRVMAR